ncbi:unnamed protein product, partial [Polarella glacialis]
FPLRSAVEAVQSCAAPGTMHQQPQQQQPQQQLQHQQQYQQQYQQQPHQQYQQQQQQQRQHQQHQQQQQQQQQQPAATMQSFRAAPAMQTAVAAVQSPRHVDPSNTEMSAVSSQTYMSAKSSFDLASQRVAQHSDLEEKQEQAGLVMSEEIMRHFEQACHVAKQRGEDGVEWWCVPEQCAFSAILGENIRFLRRADLIPAIAFLMHRKGFNMTRSSAQWVTDEEHPGGCLVLSTSWGRRLLEEMGDFVDQSRMHMGDFVDALLQGPIFASTASTASTASEEQEEEEEPKQSASYRVHL